MTGRDPDLHPKNTYVVDYPGGSMLASTCTIGEAMEQVRQIKGCPTGRLTAWRPSPEELYQCQAHGMEILGTT